MVTVRSRRSSSAAVCDASADKQMPLIGSQSTYVGVDHTDRPQRATIPGDNRRAGVKTHIQVSSDQRVVDEALIRMCVGYPRIPPWDGGSHGRRNE